MTCKICIVWCLNDIGAQTCPLAQSHKVYLPNSKKMKYAYASKVYQE